MPPAENETAAAKGKGAVKSQLPTDMALVDEKMKSLSADIAIMTATMTPEEREKYIAEVASIAAMRKHPFGQFTQKLLLPERPGYKRHWFNDTAGRVDDAETNGWKHVKDKAGKSVRRIVGTQRNGSPLEAYAMEIPKVFWDQDMRRRHDRAEARMDQIRKQPISVPSGKANRTDLDKFYSPKAEALSIRTVDIIEQRPEKSGA